MTKDELIAKQKRIIEEQSALILRFMKIGQEEYQAAFDLFCKIEVLPTQTEPERVSPISDPKKVFELDEKRIEVKRKDEKKEKPCPRCPEHRPRKIYPSGAYAPYCGQCLIDRRQKKTANSNNLEAEVC